jgi:hypothetical protein
MLTLPHDVAEAQPVPVSSKTKPSPLLAAGSDRILGAGINLFGGAVGEQGSIGRRTIARCSRILWWNYTYGSVL